MPRHLPVTLSPWPIVLIPKPECHVLFSRFFVLHNSAQALGNSIRSLRVSNENERSPEKRIRLVLHHCKLCLPQGLCL